MSIGAVLLAAAACSASGGSPGGSPSGPGSGPDGGNGTGAQGNNTNVLIDGGPGIASGNPGHQNKFPEQAICQGTSGKWGEALQKALWFFNVNKSGPGVTGTYVQWRGDAHVGDGHLKLSPNDPNGVDMSESFIANNRAVLDPDNNGEVDLGGGFHDAGDYIKFGLTTGFAASTLAWSLYEFPSAYQTTGLEQETIKLLQWFGDYLLKSSFLDGNGNLVAFGQQVGDATDHTCGWMPPEVRLTDFCPRKGYFATSENPAADVTATGAAALALIGLVTRNSDAAYSRKCLEVAQALYEFASRYPSVVATTSGGLYQSEYAWDDLAWAAVWLYESTGDAQYLDDILKPGGWLEGIPGFVVANLTVDDPFTEIWAHCWNSLRSGVFLKLAQLLKGSAASTQYAKYADGLYRIARKDALKWPDGTVQQTAAGFSMMAAWGSGRYNSAGQFTALLYHKYFGAQDSAASSQIVPWAQRQMNYLLGDNPLKLSYMMGFTDNYAKQPHHPAGHASTSGEPDVPPENKHIVWGALVNGPSDLNDGHVDKRSDYGQNEVTIDYNASFVAALAAHYTMQGAGQCPLADWPPLEPPGAEFYTRSRINSAGSCRSQVEVTLINHTIHHPRYDENLSVRYFFDVSELQAQGKSEKDVTASLIYDRGANEYGQPTSMDGPLPCSKNTATFYYEMGFRTYKFWGEIVKLKAPRTFIIDIGTNNMPGCLWTPSNDWSYDSLPQAGEQAQLSPHVAVYSQGKLVWGEEPTCNDEVKQVVVPETVY